jgi:hypothetical protein
LASLSPGKLQKHELLKKNPLNPFGTKRKFVGKGRASLVLKIFFPESENNFKYGFWGVKVGDFPQQDGT